ncbi:MAG: helix-turn-helix domain-containing protein, partial [Candidatus Ornithomonoglobus sp.]
MFWDCFYRLCEKSGTKPNPLAKELGISSGSITKWKNGGIPNGETLIKIADYFNCSIDYLLGREHQSFNVNNTGGINNSVVGHTNDHVIIQSGAERQLSAQERDLIRIYNDANGKTQHKIMDFVYGLEEEE